MIKFPKRGEVYWVRLDPAIGSEIKKTRPGLIVSNDVGNEVSTRVIVAPITSEAKKLYPFEAEIILKGNRNKVLLDQMRTLDKRRLGEKMAEVSLDEMEKVDKALKLVLNLD
ncbi:MAG: type II toxin-antitoxin system PemK/MazF family toxin [Chlamydiae bacterium]|nr:type II toxin-antitoxin system PemK/MazF family toxin [Chlamydiota bacterium]MBI3277427.1 type II toxin-antitoxin system PemK/MazF family toxin [Chlamydiota bacterium]